ncbi:D-lactonohydrolase-like protein [Rhodofomes roseus]|uniref:D-lactonohydrolase-like protein n=1 Tax=Rhodofomes roseus TaxID=34475 RepID=A0ABQ8KKA4_9APHY|nr:D-lactonohydrolase-like protein [Rhodofomes roseus]KAH9837864.1 D-lactonohydrolase-like protein [Rhodofomes roseus]
MLWQLGLTTLAAFGAWKWSSSQEQTISYAGIAIPPQAVVIDPRAYNVLGEHGSFRQNSFTEFFNPTNTSPPFFQIFHPEFLRVLGDRPTIRTIASRPGTIFAHEAPVWFPESDEVFFGSHCQGPEGWRDCRGNNFMSKISMREVKDAVRAAGTKYGAPLNITVTQLETPEVRQKTWGATGPYRSSLILINSGNVDHPSSLALMNPAPPYNVTVLFDNYYGRQFNSLNDGKIHPKSHKIFVTDPTYGFLQHFREPPTLHNQVYRFDPDTGHVRVVSDELIRPNGLAFSADGNTAYVADTGAAIGFHGRNQTLPATIYEFDVNPKTQVFENKRVFAYIDAGVPDGIQLDKFGNVYSSCGDGVHVWNHDGVLIGKFFVGQVSCNIVFAGDGNLIILSGDQVFLAEVAAGGIKLAYP